MLKHIIITSILKIVLFFLFILNICFNDENIYTSITLAVLIINKNQADILTFSKESSIVNNLILLRVE